MHLYLQKNYWGHGVGKGYKKRNTSEAMRIPPAAGCFDEVVALVKTSGAASGHYGSCRERIALVI